MRIDEALARFPLFDHFSAEHRTALADCASRVRFPPGVIVVGEGDESRDAYLLSEGTVRVERSTPYGKYTLANLESGDLFGETAFIDHSLRSGDAVTTEAAELVLFPQATLSASLDRDPKLAVALFWAFWKSLSIKLRETNERLTHFFSETSPPKVTRPTPRRHPTGSFRVDLATKRELFKEQTLSTMEINFLSSLSKEKKFRSGEVIFREGDPGDNMYITLEGRVMISKYVPGAGEEALAFLERGDYFGEMALIDNQPRSAEAKAHDGHAVVLAIPREVLEGILDIHKVSSLRLLKILCGLVSKRLREVDDKIVGWYILAAGTSG